MGGIHLFLFSNTEGKKGKTEKEGVKQDENKEASYL